MSDTHDAIERATAGKATWNDAERIAEALENALARVEGSEVYIDRRNLVLAIRDMLDDGVIRGG